MTNHNTNPSTTLQATCAEQIFMSHVQQHARQTINNIHAGDTLDEMRFIHNYFMHNQTQRIYDAIIQCAYSMLEQYRPNELQSN